MSSRVNYLHVSHFLFREYKFTDDFKILNSIVFWIQIFIDKSYTLKKKDRFASLFTLYLTLLFRQKYSFKLNPTINPSEGMQLDIFTHYPFISIKFKIINKSNCFFSLLPIFGQTSLFGIHNPSPSINTHPTF